MITRKNRKNEDRSTKKNMKAYSAQKDVKGDYSGVIIVALHCFYLCFHLVSKTPSTYCIEVEVIALVFNCPHSFCISDAFSQSEITLPSENDYKVTDKMTFIDDVRRVLHYSPNIETSQRSQRIDARADAYARWLYNHFKWLEKHYPDFPPDASQAVIPKQD